MSETATMTLTGFLLARIAEDAAVATALIDEGPWNAVHRGDLRGPTRDDEYSGLNIGAGRVLADCEAKRQIVEDCYVADCIEDDLATVVERDRATPYVGARILRALAAIWSDHPDYRQEWRP